MNDRVRRQEEARGWHKPAIEDSAPTFGDYAKDHPNPDAREWDHDRRLRGQYE